MLYQRILITGANGLLGQELVAQLSRHAEYDVLATARDPEPRFQGGSCGYVPLDITDAQAVRRLFQDFTPTVVINCAAMTQVDQCEIEKEACWRVNVEAVETLARLCRQFGARLIQVSTDFVFDGTAGPYHETDRPNPINFYGRSKLASENVVREAGIDRWAIARTVLVYGTGVRLGRSNIALWVIEQLSQGRRIRIVTDQWRTPTYVVDLATGIERIVRYNKHGIYHISGREFLTVYDFACLIADVFDLDRSLIEPVDSATLNQVAPRPPRTGFIILKAETELGYRPRSIPEALRHLGQRLGLPVTMP
ncbi:MAG: dTDP-4-dehydrorhamnose reductase [Rhodothermus sp.]|nr:dTDP-4-dehydrorhamnose reductase [Rhodothermus sp.]